jgi:hypothetical protein
MKVGPVGSGAAVIADASVTDEIRVQHRKLIGIEMEPMVFLLLDERRPYRNQKFSQ